MAQLAITAASSEELRAAMQLANELADHAGGWVWPINEPRAFTLDVPYASDEELREAWRRVKEGEQPGLAYRAVRGPGYRFREKVKAQVRPGRRSDISPGFVEIRHKNTGEVLLRVEGDTLEGAYLAGANLDGAGLAGQNLREAELQGASLIRSELAGARLYGADLRGTALMGANLANADLDTASLWGAPCLEADLAGANLRTADLRGADLTGAVLVGTDLSRANLHSARFGTARYDVCTRWPKDFDPRQQRAVRVGWFLDGPPSEAAGIDESQAIATARRAVAVNDAWAGPVSCEVQHEGDRWLVHVRRFDGDEADVSPACAIGVDCVVEIEESGRVVGYS
jgi:Pentapeptide repeats (8 copies)